MPADFENQMSVPEQVQSRPNQSFLSQKEEASYSRAPQEGQSLPSTTIPKASRTAWSEARKARSECNQITDTYSRLRKIYNLAPYQGYSMFGGILSSSDATRIGQMIRDTYVAAEHMEKIAAGDEGTINHVRKEYGKALEDNHMLPKSATAEQEGGEEAPAQVDDSLELIDYLRQRHFWRTENEIYNTTRSMYVRRDGWRDTVLALRSNFEADEDEGWLSAATKWVCTIGSSKEALKYINKVQGMYLPYVPHHVAGVENRHLLIPDTIRHLDALDNSRLPEIQEAYVRVNDKKDSALKTAEVLLDVAEVTKAASEMVVSTGVTILSGGNPAAEALVGGLYSGALNLAEQASKSSIAEGDFKKAKRQLDASGLDPDSEEYKNALAALEKKRKDAEVDMTEVLKEAGTSAAMSLAPVGAKRLGKVIGGSNLGTAAKKFGGKVTKKLSNSAPANFVKNKLDKFKEFRTDFAKKRAKKKMERALAKEIDKGVKLKTSDKARQKAFKKAAAYLGAGKNKIVAFGKGAKDWFAGLSPVQGLKKRWGQLKGLLERKRMTRQLAKEIDNGTKFPVFGKRSRKLYHKLFDWASDEAFAQRQLIRQMKKMNVKFSPSETIHPDVNKFLKQARENAKRLPLAQRDVYMESAVRQAQHIQKRAILQEFDEAYAKKLGSKVALTPEIEQYLNKRLDFLKALDDADAASVIAGTRANQFGELGKKAKEFAKDKIGISAPSLDSAKGLAKDALKRQAQQKAYQWMPSLFKDKPEEFDLPKEAQGKVLNEDHTLYGMLKKVFEPEEKANFEQVQLPELEGAMYFAEEEDYDEQEAAEEFKEDVEGEDLNTEDVEEGEVMDEEEQDEEEEENDPVEELVDEVNEEEGIQEEGIEEE